MMASSLNYEREILHLESATIDVYIESVTILLRILDNVIREPQNERYRKIRLENKLIKEKLLCLDGVRQLLHKIGFVEVPSNWMTCTFFLTQFECFSFLFENLIFMMLNFCHTN